VVWTVKHEWVYLRPAANGLEQKRSLIEFFDWYNRCRPHQALGWQTPDEVYFDRPTLAVPERRNGAGAIPSARTSCDPSCMARVTAVALTQKIEGFNFESTTLAEKGSFSRTLP
jgi:hypothetical protein